MQVTNWKSIGDAPLPPDNSVREASRDAAHKILTDLITDERMQSAAWVSDAQGDFSDAEYSAITEAIVAGDAMQVGTLTMAAVRASIRRGAVIEADIRLDALELEDAADYYMNEVAS